TDFTNIDLYYPSLVNGIDISGNNKQLTLTNIVSNQRKHFIKDNSYFKDYGYVLYQSSTNNYDLNIPILSIGTEITPVNIGTTYKRIKKVDSITSGHHLYDSKIRFTQDFFDRSNATIWKDAARSATYYESGHPRDFHITELNQRTFYEWLNVGYRGMVYIMGVSEDYTGEFNGSVEDLRKRRILRVFLCNEDKTGVENYNNLTYTGDSFAVAKTEGGAVVYDDDGYAKIGYFQMSQPIMVLRMDDGFATQVTHWVPYMTTKGVSGLFVILTGSDPIVGNYWKVENGTGVTWEQVATAAAAGWEICSHGVDDDDLDLAIGADVEAKILASITLLRNKGYAAKQFVPHKYGNASKKVRYEALRYCKTTHGGYTMAYEGANPKTLILDNLSSIRGDIAGDFQLIDPDGIIAIKAEIDAAEADNRLIMLFFHAWDADKQAGLDEIIDYVQAKGIVITTLTNALSYARYM
ncbi:MAG TPA: polysaccharide deacetylase family protein, partial [Methanosarcinales archaeon]|nr:polysaccharide deacetylase family protein [Methanosarcinales archaeon]